MHASVRVGIEYLYAWLDGCGCVPVNKQMKSTAAIEVARAQIWQMDIFPPE